MFLLLLLFTLTAALRCKIGDMNYLTTSESVPQTHHCTINNIEAPLYIEFERYPGKTEDVDAYLTFTFVGSSRSKIQFGLNKVITNGNVLTLPTQSTLENSLLLFISKNLSIMFRPRGYTQFIPLATRNGDVGDVLESIEIDAFSQIGMTQRIVQLTTNLPNKTVYHPIEHLEQRVVDIESHQMELSNTVEQLKSENAHLTIQKKEWIALSTRNQAHLKTVQNDFNSLQPMVYLCILLTFVLGMLTIYNGHKKKNKFI